MCGCSNNGNNSNSCNPCTILLIIVIFANQGLLDGCQKSKNALTLLFLYWLCASNKGNQNNCAVPMMPMSCNCGCNSGCGCKKQCCKCKCKEKKCKCKKIKVCCNNSCC